MLIPGWYLEGTPHGATGRLLFSIFHFGNEPGRTHPSRQAPLASRGLASGAFALQADHGFKCER